VLNSQLTARSALNDAVFEYPGFSIKELPDIRLLSFAVNSDQTATASAALEEAAGLAWPEVGGSSANNDVRCLGLQAEQVFLLSSLNDAELAAQAAKLAETGAVTDQSDSWVTLEVAGARRHEVLERICPIDIDENIFTDGSVARTSMEHLSAIVMRVGDQFILLSPRSSAESFLHAVTQSAEYVL